MEQLIKGTNHGANPLDLRGYGRLIELTPCHVHCNENGSLENKPTFAIVAGRTEGTNKIIPLITIQASLKELNEGLADIGYKIVKI